MEHDIRALFKSTQSDLISHNGEEVIVGEMLTDDERDPEVGTMYHITFKDGTKTDAFEDELTFIRFFEVCFIDMDGYESYSICIKGVQQPSIEEAERFVFQDMHKIGMVRVSNVIEWYRDEAVTAFDFDNEENWPIFGL